MTAKGWTVAIEVRLEVVVLDDDVTSGLSAERRVREYLDRGDGPRIETIGDEWRNATVLVGSGRPASLRERSLAEEFSR